MNEPEHKPSPRQYYAHLSMIETRLRNKVRAARRRGDFEKADELWQKVLVAKQKRMDNDYRKANDMTESVCDQ